MAKWTRFPKDYMEYDLCQEYAKYCNENIQDFENHESSKFCPSKEVHSIVTVFEQEERSIRIIRTNFDPLVYNPSEVEEPQSLLRTNRNCRRRNNVTEVEQLDDKKMNMLLTNRILWYQQRLVGKYEKFRKFSHALCEETLKRESKTNFHGDKISLMKMRCCNGNNVINFDCLNKGKTHFDEYENDIDDRMKSIPDLITESSVWKFAPLSCVEIKDFPIYRVVTTIILFYYYHLPTTLTEIQVIPFDLPIGMSYLHIYNQEPKYLTSLASFVNKFHSSCIEKKFIIQLLYQRENNKVSFICPCKIGQPVSIFRDLIKEVHSYGYKGLEVERFMKQNYRRLYEGLEMEIIAGQVQFRQRPDLKAMRDPNRLANLEKEEATDNEDDKTITTPSPIRYLFSKVSSIFK